MANVLLNLLEKSSILPRVKEAFYKSIPTGQAVNLISAFLPNGGDQMAIEARQNPVLTDLLLRTEPAAQKVKSFMEHPPHENVQLPAVTSEANTPEAKVAKALWNYLGLPALNYSLSGPSRYVGGITRTGEDIGSVAKGEKINPKQTAANVGDIVNGILGISSLPAVEGVFNTAATQTMLRDMGLLPTVARGFGTGARYGAASGFAQGVSQNVDIEDNTEYAMNVIKQILSGSGIGGVIGGATAGAGYGFQKLKENWPSISRTPYKTDAQGREHMMGKYISERPTDRLSSTTDIGDGGQGRLYDTKESIKVYRGTYVGDNPTELIKGGFNQGKGLSVTTKPEIAQSYSKVNSPTGKEGIVSDFTIKKGSKIIDVPFDQYKTTDLSKYKTQGADVVRLTYNGQDFGEHIVLNQKAIQTNPAQPPKAKGRLYDTKGVGGVQKR